MRINRREYCSERPEFACFDGWRLPTSDWVRCCRWSNREQPLRCERPTLHSELNFGATYPPLPRYPCRSRRWHWIVHVPFPCRVYSKLWGLKSFGHLDNIGTSRSTSTPTLEFKFIANVVSLGICSTSCPPGHTNCPATSADVTRPVSRSYLPLFTFSSSLKNTWHNREPWLKRQRRTAQNPMPLH